MARRNDLPRNRKLRAEIQALERVYGPENVFWDTNGGWVQINNFRVPQGKRIRYNFERVYVILMIPSDYGERSGRGAGAEEIYVPWNLRGKDLRSPARPWFALPNVWRGMDRRNGRANRLKHQYACVHFDFDPQRDSLFTSLKVFAAFLSSDQVLGS